MAMNVATNVVFDYFGTEVYHTILAVRPVLHLNLSSSNLYSYVGTVCSDGTSNEQKSEWETISMLESTTPALTTAKPVSITTVYRDTQKLTEKISSINTSLRQAEESCLLHGRRTGPLQGIRCSTPLKRNSAGSRKSIVLKSPKSE